MFHSDRGSQYTAFAFRKLLDELNVLQSFSKKGYPFDNACCESFFKYLKKEETNRRNFRTYRDLYHSVFQYIEGFYNSRRPHGSLGYLTPDEMEATFRDRQVIYPFPENIFKNRVFFIDYSPLLLRIKFFASWRVMLLKLNLKTFFVSSSFIHSNIYSASLSSNSLVFKKFTS